MTDHKFTDEEIKTALWNCFVEPFKCSECPLADIKYCRHKLYADIINLLNAKNAEIERLEAELEDAVIQRDYRIRPNY